ncbi:MAG: hypothetical protein ABSA01_07665 [Anaerolineales bacterium]
MASLLLVAVFTWPQIYGTLAGAVAGIAICATAALLPPWLVWNRVERLNEN